jgi:hypothetical protein
MKQLLVLLYFTCTGTEIYAHGRSPAMTAELNAPVPGWMSLAEPIIAAPAPAQSNADTQIFRPRSGGATNSQNRVQVPAYGIDFAVPGGVDWRGTNKEGYGVSLNSSGTNLLINTGHKVLLYEVSSTGEFREKPIRLPYITYDAGLKGFIGRWAWAGDNVMVGHGEVADESGHTVVESRLYVWHVKEQALARLDFSALNLPIATDVDLIGVGQDLQHLRIRAEGEILLVRADLTAPPKLITASKSPLNSAPKANPLQNATAAANARREESNEPPVIWTWLIAGIIALLGFCFWQMKRRKRI